MAPAGGLGNCRCKRRRLDGIQTAFRVGEGGPNCKDLGARSDRNEAVQLTRFQGI